MKNFLLFCFLGMQISMNAQELKRTSDPFTHQTRILAKPVQLKGSFYATFRSIDSLVFICLEGWGKGAAIVNEHDKAILITSNDTIIISPTGTQGFHETGHGHYTQEYYLGFQNLVKLSNEPLVSVWRYHSNGVDYISIPVSNRGLLIKPGKELLSEIDLNIQSSLQPR